MQLVQTAVRKSCGEVYGNGIDASDKAIIHSEGFTDGQVLRVRLSDACSLFATFYVVWTPWAMTSTL